jgi:hypothetical protein
MDQARVKNCPLSFAFQCPRQWDKLQPTDDPRTRFCPQCQTNVHYCRSAEEARQCAATGACVALDVQLVQSKSAPQASEDMGFITLVAGRLERPPLPPALTVGRQVAITEGALQGAEGEIESIRESRGTVTVRVVLLGRPATVELSYLSVTVRPDLASGAVAGKPGE